MLYSPLTASLFDSGKKQAPSRDRRTTLLALTRMHACTHLDTITLTHSPTHALLHTHTHTHIHTHKYAYTCTGAKGSDDQFAIDGQLLSKNLKVSEFGMHTHKNICSLTYKYVLTHLNRTQKEAACSTDVPIEVELRIQDGYDHSYYFIASFIDDHLQHHAKHLLNNN